MGKWQRDRESHWKYGKMMGKWWWIMIIMIHHDSSLNPEVHHFHIFCQTHVSHKPCKSNPVPVSRRSCEYQTTQSSRMLLKVLSGRNISISGQAELWERCYVSNQTHQVSSNRLCIAPLQQLLIIMPASKHVLLDRLTARIFWAKIIIQKCTTHCHGNPIYNQPATGDALHGIFW